MEMIAMLGGLGAAGELSPAARAAGNAITMAKSVDEVAAVSSGLPNMGLSKEEELILKVMIDKKIADLTEDKPFYKKGGYWLVVGLVAAAAWYHRDRIKSAIGLSGYNPKAINPGTARPKAGWKTFDPYAKQTEMAKKIDDERWEARQAAKKARRAAKRREKRRETKKAAR